MYCSHAHHVSFPNNSQQWRHLAAGVDGVGKHGVAVGVVQALLGGQLADVVVAVAIVGGAGHLAEVRRLVKRRGRLVLAVAAAGEVREVVPVEVAVDLEAARGLRVCEDAVAAAVELVGAVVAGRAAVGRAALLRDLVEDVDNGVAGAGRRRLEVLLDLGGGARLGRLRGRVGQGHAVLERVDGARLAAAGAVALHLRALLVARLDGAVHGLGDGAVDLGLDGVGRVRDGANQLAAGLVGVRQDAGGGDGVLATGGEIVRLGEVEGDLDGLASVDLLEVGIGQVLRAETETETLELDIVA